MARLRLCINFDYNIDDSITLRELGNRNNGSINQLMRSCLHKRIQCQGMNKVISSSYSQWQHRRPIPSLAIIGPLPLQTRIPARYIHYHDHAKKFLSLYTRPVPFTPYNAACHHCYSWASFSSLPSFLCASWASAAASPGQCELKNCGVGLRSC